MTSVRAGGKTKQKQTQVLTYLIKSIQVERIQSMKKFMVLWHLTRNKAAGVIPGKPLRTFDRYAEH